MSSLPQARGPGRNKRKWSLEEDDKLVECLLELHNSGSFQADNGFKSGAFTEIEAKLQSKLPGCGLKARPHIESRIKTLKARFAVVYDLLSGQNTSGFGWDPIKKCVTAEKPVWDAYCAVHKDAEKVRDTPFPLYEDLSIIFGKDRATGRDVEAPADVVEELERDGPHGFGNYEGSESFSLEEGSSGTSKSKKRKSGFSEDALIDGMKEASQVVAAQIKESTNLLSQAVGFDLIEKQTKINGELQKLVGLTDVDKYKAGYIICGSPFTTNLFLSLGDDEKEKWVKLLLNGSL